VNGMRLGWAVLSGLVALALLRRAPPLPTRRGLVESAIGGAILGAAAGALGAAAGASQRGGAPALSMTIPYWIGAAVFLLAEEVIFRGVLQRSLELDLAPSVSTQALSRWKGRLAAGALTAALGIVALAMTTGLSTRLAGLMISLQVVATLVRAVTGRVSAAVLARLAGLAVCTFL
jgi:membrane protease YdiL (CAAX protease family)